MKKKISRLRLDRETVRNLTPDNLSGVAGGARTDDSCWASCPDFTVTRPQSVCNSCLNTCDTCTPTLCN